MAVFWNTNNPDRPEGKWDPKAQLDIPFKWTDWLAALGKAYASHVIECEAPVILVGSSQNGGIITPVVRIDPGFKLNKKYYVECQITTDGNPPFKDNRRVYLKMVER